MVSESGRVRCSSLTSLPAQDVSRSTTSAEPIRWEIETALGFDVTVLPVLLYGARMPRVDELPASLAPLTRPNALELRHKTFPRDLDALVEAIVRLARSGARRFGG